MSNPSKPRRALLAPVLGLILSSHAFAHSFLTADPSDDVEQSLWEFNVAQENASRSGASSDTIMAAQSVYDDFWKWDQHSKTTRLTACFWNGSTKAQLALITVDKAAWEGYANITVDYYSAPSIVRKCANADSADIRISLNGNDGKLDYDPKSRPRDNPWSLVGAQANFPPPGKNEGSRYLVTVSLPKMETWVIANDLGYMKATVGHELGHARGLLHEHQRQECEGWFDIDEIAKDNKWSKEMATANVASFLQVHNLRSIPTLAGSYDPMSIMQYTFRETWWRQVPGKTNPCIRTFDVIDPSPGDKATLVAAYGRLVAQGGPGSAPIQAIGFNDAVTRLHEAVEVEHVRAKLLSGGDVDALIKDLSQDTLERQQDNIQKLRSLGAAADRGAPLDAAAGALQAAALKLQQIRSGVRP